MYRYRLKVLLVSHYLKPTVIIMIIDSHKLSSWLLSWDGVFKISVLLLVGEKYIHKRWMNLPIKFLFSLPIPYDGIVIFPIISINLLRLRSIFSSFFFCSLLKKKPGDYLSYSSSCCIFRS